MNERINNIEVSQVDQDCELTSSSRNGSAAWQSDGVPPFCVRNVSSRNGSAAWQSDGVPPFCVRNASSRTCDAIQPWWW